MAEPEKPFICYKNGWSLKITPQNAAGGWALVVWFVFMIVPTALLIWLLSRQPSEAVSIAAVTGFVLYITGWVIAMFRWTYLRSEVVDVNELLKLKRELDARKAAGKR